MAVEDTIRRKLVDIFAPGELTVINESHLHAGHVGSPGNGESHFRVRIVSEVFEGKTRLARHRLVNEALAEELEGGVHALAIRALTPGEAAGSQG